MYINFFFNFLYSFSPIQFSLQLAFIELQFFDRYAAKQAWKFAQRLSNRYRKTGRHSEADRHLFRIFLLLTYLILLYRQSKSHTTHSGCVSFVKKIQLKSGNTKHSEASTAFRDASVKSFYILMQTGEEFLCHKNCSPVDLFGRGEFAKISLNSFCQFE
jgi:hypothetical protein